MKNKLNILLGILVVFILIPQIALASWWNPFSWSWKKLFTPPAKQQTQVAKVKTQETQQDPSSVTSTQKPVEEISNKKEEVKVNKSITVKDQIETPPANTTYCNGIYWSKCAVGQDLVCPASGNAYCQIHYQEPQTQKPPQQIIEETYRPTDEKLEREIYQKDTRAEDLIAEYNSKINEIEEDILDLYDEYAKQIESIMDQTIPMEFINAQVDKKKAERDQKIRSLEAKKQRLYLDYSSKINSL